MLKHIPSMAASYWNVASWLVADIVRTLRLRIALLVGVSVAVTLSKVVTFGGFLLFLNSYVASKPIVIPKVDIEIPSVDPMYWGLGILISGLVMGGLSYLEAYTRVRLAADYGLSAMRRAFDAFSRSDFEIRNPKSRSFQFKLRLMGGDAWAMIRAGMPLLGSILPLIQLATAAVILFLMSWHLALIIAMLGILYLVPFYFINRRVIAAGRRRLQTMPEFRSVVLQSLTDIAFPPFRKAMKDRAKDRLFRSDYLYGQVNSFLTIRTIKGTVTFLSTAFLALFMFVMILYVTYIGTESALIGLAAYSIVLLHAYDSANKLSGQIASFNRFLPQFRRFVDILAREGQPLDPEPTPRPPALRLSAPRRDLLPGSLETLSLQPGKLYRIVQPTTLSLRAVDIWLSGIGIGGHKRLRPFLVPSPADVPNLTLRELVDIGATETSDPASAQILALPFVVDFLAQLPDKLDTAWHDARAQMPEAVALAFCVFPALATGANTILIGSRTFKKISKDQLASVTEQVPDAAWLFDVDTGGLPDNLPDDGAFIALATEAGIVGLGAREWAIAAILANPASFAKRGAKGFDGSSPDDDLDDDLMEG